MFRFLHSSDLHIGKRFGNLPEDLRGRLREARHGAIGRLAGAAHDHGASAILLAGDTFDTETPTPAILRQALAEMGHHAHLTWVLLPGNHDSLLGDQLWDAAGSVAPANVVLAVEAAPIELTPRVVVLPAPCTTRRPGRDLTGWMDAVGTPEGALRIGLAHGPIQQFSEEAAASDVIAPDRAHRAGLDYLALGDWHGRVTVNARTHYSGTPEPDRFKHDLPGQALLVDIESPGATPAVSAVDTGSFLWRTVTLDLLASEDAVAALETHLPEGIERRQTLLRAAARGRIGLSARATLYAAVEAAAPDFALFEFDTSGLAIESSPTDLDQIDRAGALRQAAEVLLAESEDTSLSGAQRGIARAALARLYSYSQEVQP